MRTKYVFVTPRGARDFRLTVFAHIGYKDITHFKVSAAFLSFSYIAGVTVPIAQDFKSIGRVFLN